MRVGFHPVADNSIRMAYVPGWASVTSLIQRVEELAARVDGGKVIPAPWEPFYKECPCCRDFRAFAWARSRLQNPSDFAVDLAFFPRAEDRDATTRDHANWVMLCAEGEPSKVTGEMMVAEALDLWEIHETCWLEQVVELAAQLNITASVKSLRPKVRHALKYLEHPVPSDDIASLFFGTGTTSFPSHGFDRELLQMDGWTQDPGMVFLPVDGGVRCLLKDILVLNTHTVALLRGRRIVRSVEWEKVTLIYIFNGVLSFDIRDEPPLTVADFKNPEAVLGKVQELYKAATERILQALATQVIRTTA